MRVAVNLASRPYVELGPTYRRLRVAIVLLALLIAPLWLLLRSERTKAVAANERVTAVQQQIQGLNQERQAFEAGMRRPENAAVLRQSHFLNNIFARKAFSWTAVMMDLENVLPAGVQVMSIDPVVDRNGNVVIRMRVSGEHTRAVDLMRNLEHSHRFLYPRLAGETAENTNTRNGQPAAASAANGRVDFDILAEYNPLPPSDKADGLGKSALKPALKPKKTSPLKRSTGASGLDARPDLRSGPAKQEAAR